MKKTRIQLENMTPYIFWNGWFSKNDLKYLFTNVQKQQPFL